MFLRIHTLVRRGCTAGQNACSMVVDGCRLAHMSRTSSRFLSKTVPLLRSHGHGLRHHFLPARHIIGRQCLAHEEEAAQNCDVEYIGVELPSPGPEPPKPFMSTIPVHADADNRMYMVILSVIQRLWESADQLEAFLSSRSEPTSMPFLIWLSDKEAVSTGIDKQRLSQLCEYLVLRRERQDDEKMDALYLSTLEMLVDKVAPQDNHLVDLISNSKESDSESVDLGVEGSDKLSILQERRDQAISLLTSNPDLYSLELAERVTGTPIIVDGYPNPIFDLIVKTDAPAAVTVEGIRRAHADAADLAADLKGRRKRSVASIIGRAKLTAEQADQLIAGTAASRILDMLLALSSQHERLSCLPDCFMPPAAPEMNSADERSISNTGENTEELWCTAPQMLSEIEVRIRGMSSPGTSFLGEQESNFVLYPGEGSSPTGPALMAILEELKSHIKQTWLDGLGR